jgi:hypothetical protein
MMGAATNFFGRNNSYSVVRFVLAGPGRRWDTAARKPNHSVEWLAIPLFPKALFFFARGSPLGTATETLEKTELNRDYLQGKHEFTEIPALILIRQRSRMM